MQRFYFGVLLLLEISLYAGNNEKKESAKEFIISNGLNIVKAVPVTTVKDQRESATCWSFGGISLIESELINQGRGNFDLSEKYIIRCNYLRKAERFIRMHGKSNFSPGGEANDVTEVIEIYGIMPEAVYPGINKNGTSDYSEMIDFDITLKTYVDSLVRNTNNYLNPDWKKEFCSLMDRFLGPVPEEFNYNGKHYTPESFAEYLGLSDFSYTLLTSFMHHKYYDYFELEVPDNWSWEKAYNMPLDELVVTLDSALIKGYTAAWSVDITEDGFIYEDGVAYISNLDNVTGHNISTMESNGSNPNKFSNLVQFDFHKKVCEPIISDSVRQTAFDNYSTTDDHLMQIVGLACNKYGQKYYYVKNSWGIDNPFNGYIFVSEQYFRFKTISIMLNKKALPEELLSKIMLKGINR